MQEAADLNPPPNLVACVGRDMIKVWPLPMETPWWEDGVQGNGSLQ
jgi:hypothetical protein